MIVRVAAVAGRQQRANRLPEVIRFILVPMLTTLLIGVICAYVFPGYAALTRPTANVCTFSPRGHGSALKKPPGDGPNNALKQPVLGQLDHLALPVC